MLSCGKLPDESLIAIQSADFPMRGKYVVFRKGAQSREAYFPFSRLNVKYNYIPVGSVFNHFCRGAFRRSPEGL